MRDNKGRFIKGSQIGKKTQFKIGHKKSNNAYVFKKGHKIFAGFKKGNKSGFKKGQVSLRKGVKLSEDIRKKISASKQEISIDKWNGFTSIKKYSIDFYRIRNYILKRDKNKCRICNNYIGVLDVHHIDYNKQNNKINNLITLCHACHSRTNYKRKDWIKYFNLITVDGGESYSF
jgi:hypothetical protein